MAGINKVILIGHLGKNPEIRTIETGIKVANFTMATTEAYKDKNGERKEITEWHNVVCWRNLADIAEKYLTKGKLIYVEGKLRTRSWEENGVKRYVTEIVADSFTMFGAKSDNADTGETPVSSPQASTIPTTPISPISSTPTTPTKEDSALPPITSESEEEDDLPF